MGKVTDGLPAEKLNAIFHHPDCRKIFNERCEAIRLPDCKEMQILQWAIKKCHSKLSFNDFDFTENEFENFMTKPMHELLPGIVLRVINILRGMAIGEYIPDSTIDTMAKERTSTHTGGTFKAHHVMSAGSFIEKAYQEIVKPIKDEVIEEFYANATIVQTNEINRVLNNVNKQMKSNTIQMQP